MKLAGNTDPKILTILEQLPDPEIPVISVVDLGIIRATVLENDILTVSITPTYSGCPAMKQIADDIISTLQQHGYPNVKVKTVYSPAWTTDWISDEAKEKLRKYGIAPPEHSSVDKRVLMGLEERVVKCPKCGSKHTKMISQFGSTACKSLYQCEDCLEPFDYFKCL